MIRFDLLFVLGLLTVSGFTDIFVDVLVRLLERRMDSEFEPHNHKDHARQSSVLVKLFDFGASSRQTPIARAAMNFGD